MSESINERLLQAQERDLLSKSYKNDPETDEVVFNLLKLYDKERIPEEILKRELDEIVKNQGS